jgi:hypothetical protein
MKSSNYPHINHAIQVTQSDDKIIIALPDGEELARITVETMNKDLKAGDKWEATPSQNFWVVFRPKTTRGTEVCASIVVD